MPKKAAMAAVIVACILQSGCARKDGQVLAKVGGTVITLAEFDGRISKLPEAYQEIARGKKKLFLEEIIKEELLYQEALKEGVDKDPETKEVIAEAKKKIYVSRILKNKVEDEVSISDDDLKKYYDEHSEEFMVPERLRASHIVVDTQQEAEEIKKELEGGADFAELAKARSKDATSKDGGDVGYFSKGQLIPEFENACFKLEVGGVGDVLKTQFGYHVIKLTEKKSPEVQEFSRVKDIIRKEMERDKKRQLLDELIKGLHDKTDIVINEELIADPPVDETPVKAE